jgi:hypothetical protein
LRSRARFLFVAVASAMFVIACGKKSHVTVGSASRPPETVFAEIPPAAGAPQTDDDDASSPSPLATTCDGVSLALVSVTTNTYGVQAVLELRNGSSAHVPLMMPGDGSSFGRRNPTLRFELSPDRVAPRSICGNMNPMSAADFVTLAPGRHAKIEWASPPSPAEPGQYTLRATYVNDPDSRLLAGTRYGEGALVARAGRTVPCKLVSNAVTFMWTQPTTKTEP